MAGRMAVQAGRRLPSREGLELALRECDAGIGSVIFSVDSQQLVAGVRAQSLLVWPDDRGYFPEVQRMGQGLAADFPAATSQVSAALNYAGAVKAFHFHLHQTDCWTPAMTDRFYDPQDESRTPYNGPGINYDWETQRK